MTRPSSSDGNTSLLPKRNSDIRKLWILYLNLALFFGVTLVALAWYRRRDYMTATLPDYWRSIFGWLAALTGAVTWASGLAWVVVYAWNRLRGQAQPKKITRDQMLERYLPAVTDQVLHALESQLLTLILVLVGVGCLYGEVHFGPTFLPPGGPIVVTPTVPGLPYTSNQKHVYYVAEGGLKIANEQAVELKEEFVALGSKVDRANLNCVAVAPSKKKVFVTDPTSGKVYILDETWKPQAVAVGLQPRCIAVSPDERKAYITNEQRAPYGTISVLEVDSGEIVHTIEHVNCPEGLAISRDGRRLYVATECGGGHDPMLVIDTATDAVVATIPDVYIGRAPAVSPDGKRVYVARVNPLDNKKFLLSVFSTISYEKLYETPFESGIVAIVVSSDGQYLFVATGHAVQILDAEKLVMQNEIQTCAPQDSFTLCDPDGVAVSDRGAIFILKKSGKIQFSGLAGLLAAGKP
jgi:DNA-binding beta-propeller fold protein YncE